jgi:hypothetical protein
VREDGRERGRGRRFTHDLSPRSRPCYLRADTAFSGGEEEEDEAGVGRSFDRLGERCTSSAVLLGREE